MKLTPKTLKILSIIFLGLAAFGFGYMVAYDWKNDNKFPYSGLPVVFALISFFLAIAARKKKDQESKGI